MKPEVAAAAGSLNESTHDGGPAAAEAGKDAAPSAGLGALLAEFGARVPIVLILLLVILVVTSVGRWHIWAGLTGGVIVAGGLLLLVRLRRLKVKVHQEGLIYQTRGKSELWRWKDVEELSVLLEKREIRDRPHGLLEFLIGKVLEAAVMASLPKAMKYRVAYELRRPGHKLVLDSSIRDHNKLGEIAGNLVRNYRLPSLLGSVRAGGTVPFGKFLIGPDGITDTRHKQQRILPWNAVAGVSVSKYAVAVNEVGGKPHWASASISEVPNAIILTELAGRIAAEKASD